MSAFTLPPSQRLLYPCPQSGSTNLFPPMGRVQVSPAPPCPGPAWRAPLHLGFMPL